MKLNELKKFIEKTLKESNNSRTISRVEELSKSIGESQLINKIVEYLDDHVLNEILDKIATEFDARKKDLVVADPQTNQPINMNPAPSPPPTPGRPVKPGIYENSHINQPEISTWDTSHEEKQGLYDSINSIWFDEFKEKVREELEQINPGNNLIGFFDKSMENKNSGYLKYLKQKYKFINEKTDMSMIAKDAANKIRDNWCGV